MMTYYLYIVYVFPLHKFFFAHFSKNQQFFFQWCIINIGDEGVRSKNYCTKHKTYRIVCSTLKLKIYDQRLNKNVSMFLLYFFRRIKIPHSVLSTNTFWFFFYIGGFLTHHYTHNNILFRNIFSYKKKCLSTYRTIVKNIQQKLDICSMLSSLIYIFL